MIEATIVGGGEADFSFCSVPVIMNYWLANQMGAATTFLMPSVVWNIIQHDRRYVTHYFYVPVVKEYRTQDS